MTLIFRNYYYSTVYTNVYRDVEIECHLVQILWAFGFGGTLIAIVLTHKAISKAVYDGSKREEEQV